MTTEQQNLQQKPGHLSNDEIPEVQKLALTGYDFNHAIHLVLQVRDAAKAREFLAELLKQDKLTFGAHGRDRNHAINLGFTYRGLEKLGVPEHYRKQLEQKAPAFREGAPVRAARRLGDSGESAAERWDPPFRLQCADVLVSIHAADRVLAEKFAADLPSLQSGAHEAFYGWTSDWLRAEHLSPDPRNRIVHFGFRDNIVRPVIDCDLLKDGKPRHNSGELLLGHPNDEQFNRWADSRTPADAARFFRNGSFAVLRQVEQHEDRFSEFLKEHAKELLRNSGQDPDDTAELQKAATYLKAKLCGRWPNGARMRPGETVEPPAPSWKELEQDSEFTFQDDKEGFGCPFGAHIRRTSPRGDPVLPLRRRPLFRRGMPYGPPFTGQSDKKERGLIGLFFCASIEDQFEHVMSEWVEKMPMGPPSRGDAKDPMVGQHDGAVSMFHIPLAGGGLELGGFEEPFVTTHGTLYAFFPSRHALCEVAGIEPANARAAQPAASPLQTAKRAEASRGVPQRASSVPSAKFAAPKDRFCDVVMEGGITSGIIYASAVAELAKHYRFRNIGGSSIGGFAAALAAAAEYCRRHGSEKGFEFLERVPFKLAKDDGHGRTSLRNMFMPQNETRRLFAIFLATLGHNAAAMRYLCGAAEALRQYSRHALAAGLVVAALVLGPFVLIWLGFFAPEVPSLAAQVVAIGSWSFALLLAFAFAVVLGVLAGFARDVLCGLVPNGFGLCRGWSEDQPTDPPDLAGFLHAAIQEAAGRDPKTGVPLTFKDLWDAPDAPSTILNFVGDASALRSINLEVYAANLAHSRPYRFPLDDADDMGRLFFRLEDMERYFPKPVLLHLAAHARPYRSKSLFDPAETKATEGYLELPQEHLPIVVAARMALSFPLLVSAVPMWAVDYEPEPRERKLSQCWMSDGGLCSNFPIHLFDSFLPKWPTFGISLQTRSKFWRGGAVWLPKRHLQGRADIWHRIEGGRLKQLTRFLLGLWMATWRWNDMTLMRMPGVRDRVVRVLLEENEGGVNIKMTGDEILELANKYGIAAAQKFLKKFAEAGSRGWSEHRWVRFNRLLIALRQQIDGFGFAASLDRHAKPIDEDIDSSRQTAPLLGHIGKDYKPAPSETPLDASQYNELKGLLAALLKLETMYKQVGSHRPYEAVPRPSLRVRHPT